MPTFWYRLRRCGILNFWGSPSVDDLNGQTRVVRADPRTPLLYILRNDLGLPGAKLGSGLEPIGVRLRDIPFTPDRVRQMLSAG
jgi:hypothetical protein